MGAKVAMTLEEEKKLVNEYIAQAIDYWSWIEFRLCLIFCWFMTKKLYDRSSRTTFYAIENFRSKVQVVDALASSLLTNEELQTWKSIEKHLGKRAKKRNTIVHSAVWLGENYPPRQRYGLIAPWFDPKTFDKVGTEKHEMLGVHELREATSEFSNMDEEVRLFLVRLAGTSVPAELKPHL